MHALYEVALDVLKRAKSPKDPRAIVQAIAATKLNTIVGPVDWSSGPVKNVSKTPLVAGQWTKTPSGFDLVIVENKTAPNIPMGGALRPLA